MILSKIHTAPTLDSFISLAEHQSKTPATFYEGKPVLYFHDTRTRAIIAKNHLTRLPFKQTDFAENVSESTSKVDSVELFVSSENFTFFNPVSCIGFVIPYPAITLHAIQRLKDPVDLTQEIQGLYMQIEILDSQNSSGQEDDDSGYIDLTLIPTPCSDQSKSSIQMLFEAVSTCSDLHPDPDCEDGRIFDDVNGDCNIRFEGNDGYEGINGLTGSSLGLANDGLPPPFPGSGGWITAENSSQYLDEDGNWIGENGVGEDPLIIS